MARFQIFENSDGQGYLLDVQSDLIDIASTRVVIPLLPTKSTPAAVPRLHPVFAISGESFVMATHLIATVPARLLVEPRGDISSQRDRITAALDMLFHGF